jgi:hypothetical protein
MCPMLEPTITRHYLIVDSEVRLSIPNTKGKGLGWVRSLLLVGYLSANFHKGFFYVNRKRESSRKGKRRCGSQLFVFE